MKFFIIYTLLFCASCSTQPPLKFIPLWAIDGPIPNHVTFETIRDTLTIEGDGIRGTLITAPLLYAAATMEMRQGKLTPAERKIKVDHHINHLVRYQTCYLLTLQSHHLEKVDTRHWIGRVQFLDPIIPPLNGHFREVEGQDLGRVYFDAGSDQRHQSQATWCTELAFTLTSGHYLHLKFRGSDNLKPHEVKLLFTVGSKFRDITL